MAYNYKIAKSVLSDKDKERLVCIALNRRADNTVRSPPSHAPSPTPVNTDNLQIDWEKATAEFDCASVSSMRVMTSSVLRKIADAGGKVGENGEALTPTPKAKGGKRKAASAAEGGEDDEEASPVVKRSKGRRKKGAQATAEGEFVLNVWGFEEELGGLTIG